VKMAVDASAILAIFFDEPDSESSRSCWSRRRSGFGRELVGSAGPTRMADTASRSAMDPRRLSRASKSGLNQ